MVQPERPPALVYLDLNHWINIAKVAVGKPSPSGYRELYAAARRAHGDGRARFVMSAALVQELWAIADPRQRHDVAAVLEELTDFGIPASPVDLMHLELLASVAAIAGDSPPFVEPFPLIGTSVLHAFGRKGGFRLVDKEGRDRTAEQLAAGGPEFQATWAAIQLQGERMLLAGAQDEDLEALRENGYRPEIPQAQRQENAAVEQYFADKQLTGKLRRGRIRDALIAREVSLELKHALVAELERRGLEPGVVLGEISRARALVLSMPTSCVRVEIKTRYHLDAAKKWTVNDLADIDALSVAIPYCDIVFTDAAVRNAARGAKLHERFATEMPRRPDDLTALLEALPASL